MVPKKIFISFSSKDIDYARAFKQALAQHTGNDCIFFSPDTIDAGDQYYDRIMQFLRGADALILLASAHSVGCNISNITRSKHVMRELKESDDLNIPIYPIDVDGVLERGSYDQGTRYIIGSYQFINGQENLSTNSFSNIIEQLFHVLKNNHAKHAIPIEDQIHVALQENRIQDAVSITRALDISKLNGNALVLSIIVSLYEQGNINSLKLNDAIKTCKNIQISLEKGCSPDKQSLALYVAGVLCKEYFHKRVIQCPLGNYSHLKRIAQQTGRLSVADKKIVRSLSSDFRAFEADWFFGT
ncbi:toll/interleukin-1 receptor domain-containing protein [Alishewanella tabrizica]|uniref:TIR domain-containing protein n=1 Tax=Alishewanella tabrizica TaxID=671278 RepID=A0ABQ2WJ63_9ALTE|nr:toll/interleukin-1 receptor domain-containing protein [Alishewanella tabrizica]GGW54572.1 hypothetical protein GCM10008111_08170 [Alishewanella tabrizica]